MGGCINIAVRYRDGVAICHQMMTGVVKRLRRQNIDILRDENLMRDLMAENNHPARFSVNNYGIVLIDYVTKTLIDANNYDTVMTMIGRDICRDHTNIEKALAAGYRVKRIVSPTGERIYENGMLFDILLDADRDPHAEFTIDITQNDDPEAVWRHHESLVDTVEQRRNVFDIIRAIGFPTRQKGLNV